MLTIFYISNLLLLEIALAIPFVFRVMPIKFVSTQLNSTISLSVSLSLSLSVSVSVSVSVCLSPSLYLSMYTEMKSCLTGVTLARSNNSWSLISAVYIYIKHFC